MLGGCPRSLSKFTAMASADSGSRSNGVVPIRESGVRCRPSDSTAAEIGTATRSPSAAIPNRVDSESCHAEASPASAPIQATAIAIRTLTVASLARVSNMSTSFAVRLRPLDKIDLGVAASRTASRTVISRSRVTLDLGDAQVLDKFILVGAEEVFKPRQVPIELPRMVHPA